MNEPVHVPVLADRVVEFLSPRAGGIHLDGTLGGGGHFRAVLAALRPRLALGMDRDLESLARAALALRDAPGEKLYAWGDFRHAARLLPRLGVARVDTLLVDFGLSSLQLGDPGRGFAFSSDGPLDMRMDRSSGPTAADLVNRLAPEEIARILREFGEERHAGRIARRIAERRAERPFATTGELAALVRGVIGERSGSIDSATRTFQALRVAVNGELAAVEAFLPAAAALLAPGGRCCVITFHSLEDRPVKRFVRRESRDCVCDGRLPACVCGHRATLRDLTPKPVEASPAEVAANPRARSAKLRAFERLAA